MPPLHNAVTNTLYEAVTNQKPHKFGDSDLFTIFWKDKQRQYGSARAFNEANERLKWFIVSMGAKVGSHAVGYRLTSKARAIARAYLELSLNTTHESMSVADRRIVDREGKPFRKASRAIRSLTSTNANTRFKQHSLNSVIRIKGPEVELFYQAALAWQRNEKCPPGSEWLHKIWNELLDNPVKLVPDGADNKRVQKAIAQALVMLDIAKRFGAPGYALPCTYIESEQGRLYAEGPISLQGCVRELRRAALRGCYDIDIENCHWTILSELAQRQGIETPNIQHYLANKKLVREQLAAELYICIDDAKFVLLALVYGALLSHSSKFHQGAIEERITGFGMINARSNLILLGLRDDISNARRAILTAAKASSCKPGFIVNDAGRQLKIVGSTPSEQLAHIVQGAESEILRACIETCDDIVVLQHDGFTCREKIDTMALSSLVHRKTGYEVSFSLTQL